MAKQQRSFEERAQAVASDYRFCEIAAVPARVVRVFNPLKAGSDYLVMATRTGYACTCVAWGRGDGTCKHTAALELHDRQSRPAPVADEFPTVAPERVTPPVSAITYAGPSYDERGEQIDSGW